MRILLIFLIFPAHLRFRSFYARVALSLADSFCFLKKARYKIAKKSEAFLSRRQNRRFL